MFFNLPVFLHQSIILPLKHCVRREEFKKAPKIRPNYNVVAKKKM